VQLPSCLSPAATASRCATSTASAGGSGEYFGDNDAHLGRICVFYHEALDGEYVPCAVLFDLEPGVIGAVTLSHRPVKSSARKTS
jgi:hypothetical protein